MTWQQISDEVNRKLVQFASPPVLPAEMVGLLNESYDELMTEWCSALLDRNEFAIQVVAPLRRGPVAIAGAAAFDLDVTNFPGLRVTTFLRGKFLQSCSGVAEWRQINFISDNDMSDLENPLRMPTEDIPKYNMGMNSGLTLKRITVFSNGIVASNIELTYVKNPAVITTVASGTPEVSSEAHYLIVRRAVYKQSGINEDVRTPVYKEETSKDVQVEMA